MDLLGKLFPNVVSAAALGVTPTIIMDCVITFFGATSFIPNANIFPMAFIAFLFVWIVLIPPVQKGAQRC